MKRLVLILALTTLATSVGAAQFEDATAALKRGDYAIALRLLRPLAEQGEPAAQFEFGVIYYEHNYYAEAVKWFRKAADQDDTNAQTMLGTMYRDGDGVPKNHAEAAKWYYKAADRGERIAQLELGVLYARGQGVPQNYTEAIKWFRKAAEQCDVNGEYNLGIAYKTGRGVSQNNAEAVVWFRKAAEQGYAEAKNQLDELSSRDFKIMEAETGCKSKYSEQKKADLFATNYKGKEMTVVGEIVGLPKGVINLKMLPSTLTLDLSINMRDPRSVYDLTIGRRVAVTFIVASAGGCFLPYSGDQGFLPAE